MTSEGKEQALPSNFGRYTLVEKLATGGMAEVFKAKILSTHGFEKLLVIKRILPHLAADKTFVSMFIDEAKLTAQLVHPKIVQVTDFGDVAGQYFIALEFVDGFDALALLRTSAQRQVRLPIPISMFIVMEVLDALDYAHHAKDQEGRPMRLVHRDISPSNVFISRRGDVKLGDFGIAHAQERESKTQAGTLKGKYGYMSPEQVVGASLDGRSDLFAVGIVLAEMLMGRRLFTAPTDLDVLLMVRDGRLERLDKYCRDIPPDLDRIVRKALRKRLSDRYQTSAEFRDDLADLLFRYKLRVGPHDVGTIAADYFNSAPEALSRLKDHGRRWEMKAPERSNRPSHPGAGPTNITTGAHTLPSAPVRTDVRTIEVTVSSPSDASVTAADSAELQADTEDPLEVVIDDDVVEDDAPPPPPQRPAGRGTPDRGQQDNPAPARPAAFSIGPAAAAPRPAPPTPESRVAAAMNQALSQPLSVVELDSYAAPQPNALMADGGSGTAMPLAGGGYIEGATPSAYAGLSGSGSIPHFLGPGGGLSQGGRSDASHGSGGGRLAPNASSGIFAPHMTGRPPDSAGDLSIISPMRVFADLAVAGETGLLRFELSPHIKEVYLVRGAPESVNSSLASERFGEYLVARGFLKPADLDNALAQLPRFSGKLGDTLVGLGLMRPLDVFRLLSQQVRERVMEIFGWVQGYFSFYRGVRNPQEAFPLGLDTFEILGAGVLTLPYEFLERKFMPLLEYRPRARPSTRIQPEAFRLGPTPRDVCGFLDGTRTLREWMGRFTSPGELLTFLRTVYLLIEADLAQFS